MTMQDGPKLSKSRDAARLSAAGRRVHRAILEAFIAAGLPPEPAELDRIGAQAGASPAAMREELSGLDVVAFDEAGRVRAAYPFSPTPTGIRMSWPGGPQVFSMCAIDALGTSAMIGRPVTITAAEPGSGAGIVVEVDGDAAVWRPDTAVVVVGQEGGDACCGPSVDRTCGTINFFTTEDAARAWTAAHPAVSSRILSGDAALAEAVDEFGLMLSGT